MMARLSMLRLVASSILASCALGVLGCDDSVGGETGDDGAGSGGAGGGDAIVPPQSIDKLDLLLVIDGSGSMGDKQGFLAASIRPFLERIRSPRCVDAAHAPIASQPALDAACPDGSVREYTPDVTVHVGLISSSLGTGSSAVCDPVTTSRLNDDDEAHLLYRSTPGTAVNDIPTYQQLGFFAWDPGGTLSPAGLSDFDELTDYVERAIRGVGEVGCGFEMPLEAMYRFLNAPAPVRRATGAVDQTLLDQRAAFVRDDSVVQIVLLSDENDVSFRSDAVAELGMSSDGTPMPRPRSECAANPQDTCCVSCIEPVPDGCPGDGGCAEPGSQSNPDNFYPADDPDADVRLRAWDQKRRFGIDFLHPVERYIEGLQSSTLTLDDGSSASNPLHATTSGARQVLFTAVVGVPWQDVARDPLDPAQGFQSGDEMLARGTWDVILGDPAANVPPTDPHMIESTDPRPGLSTDLGSSVVNGNEWETGYEDLQYACVFDLPTAAVRECDPDTNVGCADCAEGVGETNKPVCDPSNELRQIRAKAYPGRRQLQVARALGDHALVVPICGLHPVGDDDPPGPVGTFIMETGLAQSAEQLANVMSGAAE